jgi:Zn-dependent protease with chaperone function
LSHRNYVNFLPLLLLLPVSLSILQGYWRVGLFLLACPKVFILFLWFWTVHCFFREVIPAVFLFKCLLISLLFLLLFIQKMCQILVSVGFFMIYRLQIDMNFLKSHLLRHTILLQYPPSCLHHFLLLIHLHLILVSQTSLIHLNLLLLRHHYSCTIH